MTRHLLALPRLLPSAVFLLSLTVTIFTRSRIGLRACSPGQLAVLAGCVLLLPHLLALAHAVLLYFVPLLMFVPMPGLDIAVSPAFTLYMLAVPVMAFWQRSKERTRLCRGQALHSYCRGISPFEFLARRFSRLTLSQVYCYIEPSAVFIAGLLTYALISAALGGWWMAAALAIAVREQGNDARELDFVLDEMDRHLEARHRAHITVLLEGQGGVALGTRSLAQSGGIATGIAVEIVPALKLIRSETFPATASSVPAVSIRTIDVE